MALTREEMIKKYRIGTDHYIKKNIYNDLKMKGKIDALIAELQSFLDDNHITNGNFEICSDYDSYLTFTLSACKPKTDAEIDEVIKGIEQGIEDEKHEAKRRYKEQKNAEKALYEKLKKKYEPSN